ncbi:hypothetical protein CUS_7350 [Ruminococcus albus 8]|uniref:Uncharacterized protein n=1 Tax=Ruminococcus albus 8 TaxID=246199 RepID=E9S7X5_RUMAL|nr:hypothetical protein CUS_7350 [Ruminococcus albus 8]
MGFVTGFCLNFKADCYSHIHRLLCGVLLFEIPVPEQEQELV